MHYIWVRVGLALLVLMPIAAYVTFRPWGLAADVLQTHGGIVVATRDDAAQFGYYGHQLFDGRATITREAQQSATLAALLAVLSRY